MTKMGTIVAAGVLLLVLSGCAPSDAAAPTPEPSAVASSDPTPIVESPTPEPPTFEAMDPALFSVAGVETEAWSTWSSQDVNFASPSRNLGCAILGPEHRSLWGCAIGEQDWEFPSTNPDDYCFDSQVSCGGGIEVEGEGLPHPRKRSDPGFPGAFVTYGADVPIRVLEYGQSVTFGNVTCYSEELGVTCTNAVSGHGFVIARDRNDIY